MALITGPGTTPTRVQAGLSAGGWLDLRARPRPCTSDCSITGAIVQAPTRKKPGKNPPQGPKMRGAPASGALIPNKIFILLGISLPPAISGGRRFAPGGLAPPFPFQNWERSDPPRPAPPKHREGAGNRERSTTSHPAGDHRAGPEAARAADRRGGERGPRPGEVTTTAPPREAAHSLRALSWINCPPSGAPPFLQKHLARSGNAFCQKAPAFFLQVTVHHSANTRKTAFPGTFTRCYRATCATFFPKGTDFFSKRFRKICRKFCRPRGGAGQGAYQHHGAQFQGHQLSAGGILML